MDIVEGDEPPHVWWCGKLGGSIEDMFTRSLFAWSQALGLSATRSFVDFIDSHFFCSSNLL